MPTAENPSGFAPIVIDEVSRVEYLGRVNIWVAHTLGAQVEFRVLAADTAAKILEAPWHERLTGLAEAAARHEQQAEEMFDAIGRKPWRLGKLSGPVLAKSREALAFLIHTTTGAWYPWTALQQLHTVSLGAISAFTAAEQLGHAMGIPALAEIAARINDEKAPHHQRIGDAVREFSARAILHGPRFDEQTHEDQVREGS